MKYLKAIIIPVLLAALGLAGCTQDEAARLFPAYERLRQSGAYEQNSRISFDLAYYGGDEDFKAAMGKAKHIVDELEVTASSVIEDGTDSGKMRAHMQSSWGLDPVTAAGELWLDLDLNEGAPKYDVIFKMPAMLKAFVPAEYAKDYVYIDYIEMAKQTAGVDIMQNPSFQMLADKTDVPAMLETFGMLSSLEGNCAVASEAAEGGGETLTLTMTDRQLKSYIIDVLNKTKDDEEMLGRYADMFSIYLSSYSAGLGTDAPEYAAGDIRQMLSAMLEAGVPRLEEYFSGNTILGGRGLSYAVRIDADGDITGEDCFVNFSVDSGVLGFTSPEGQAGRVDFTVNAATEYAPAGEAGVEYPVLTNANSVDFYEAMKAEMAREAEEAKYYFPAWGWGSLDGKNELPIKGAFDGGDISGGITVLSDETELYMPITQAAELFGGSVEWDGELDAALWTRNGESCVIFSEGGYLGGLWLDDEEEFWALTEGSDYDFGYLYENSMYVMLNQVEYFTGADFGYDEAEGLILVK